METYNNKFQVHCPAQSSKILLNIEIRDVINKFMHIEITIMYAHIILRVLNFLQATEENKKLN